MLVTIWFQILISVQPEQKCCKNTVLVEWKACYFVPNGFLSRSDLISLMSRLKIAKMSKKCFCGKQFQELMG